MKRPNRAWVIDRLPFALPGVHYDFRRSATRTADKGNTITEYAIVGALVVVVSIAALQFMSGGLNSAMATIRDDMQSKQIHVASVQAVQHAVNSGQISALSAADQALLEESLSQKLQTTGSNGSTEVLAKQLSAAADLLRAQGKIDQSQYNILVELANQGHKMAQTEAYISQAESMANGSFDAFNNTKYTVDGQTYTSFDLGHLIGFDGPTPESFSSADILNADLSSAGPQLSTFINLYQQALASGALDDPDALSTVQSAATQIASLGEITEHGTADFKGGDVSDPASILASEASHATNMNSSKICKKGKSKDNGVLCRP